QFRFSSEKEPRFCYSDLPLSGWHHLNLAKKFDLPPLEDKMPRVDGSTLSVEEFREKYEQPRIPCMITGLTETWAAHENWKIDKLLEKYANATFKCGESPNAKPVYMKFKYYAEYMRKNKDDSPLYIFDGKFGRRHATMDMVNDYEVPPYFRGNLFGAFGSYKRKPLFRWVFIHPDAPRDLVRIPKDQRGIHAKAVQHCFLTSINTIAVTRHGGCNTKFLLNHQPHLRVSHTRQAKTAPGSIFYERLAEKHPELLDIINKAMLDPKPIANGYDTSDEQWEVRKTKMTTVTTPYLCIAPTCLVRK
ncbi:hypothetical protein OSTOST_21295, partial [Ostertagia ostertagi]